MKDQSFPELVGVLVGVGLPGYMPSYGHLDAHGTVSAYSLFVILQLAAVL